MNKEELNEYAERLQTALYTTTRKLNGELAEHMGDGLTLTQFFLLRYMDCYGRATVTELAQLMGVKPSAITGIVDRMYKNQLVGRSRDDGDRRVVFVYLTEKGKNALSETEQKRIEIVKKYISYLEPHALEVMINSFEQLNKIVQKENKSS